MKVLVIQNKMIGDVLASTVICEALKKQHNNWIIHYMIQPNTLAVVENNPFIDKIILFNDIKNKGFIKLIKFGFCLKKENYDAIIDAYGKWQSIVPSFFSGAKTRISYRKWYTCFLYSKTIVPEKNCIGEAIYQRLQLAAALTSTVNKELLPKIYLRESEIEIAKKSILKNLNATLPIIMISVLGSEVNKSLPANYMAEVLDEIVKIKKLQLLFNFMPSQETEARLIYNLCQPETQKCIVIDYYNKSLRKFLAVLSQCDALVGNEGGAINMALAMNIKTFTIFSPWIDKSTWNIKNDNFNHIAVHLEDYFPEIYHTKHPKQFKNKALELYDKLTPNLFLEKLKLFISGL